MSFLDRFKLQAKYKSTDPDVRLAGVPELTDSPEDAAVLAALAREDADVRVRRAAAARVGDIGTLAEIARTESDEALRADVLDRLSRFAVSTELTDEAIEALGALTDQKQIGTVAKSSPVEHVRLVIKGGKVVRAP